MQQEKRREYMLELIRNSPITTTSTLASMLNVSGETIRRDLGYLEEVGLIAKVHGGVVAINQKGVEIPYQKRAEERVLEKQAIAREAYKLIKSGDSMILDGGTTIFELAKLLVDREDILVITPSLVIGSFLISSSKCRVFLTGGWVRREDMTMFGNAAINTIEKFHVDKVFVGGAGVTCQHGLTDYFDEEVNLRKTILKASDEKILLVDNSKLVNTALLSVAPITEFTTIITDEGSPEDETDKMRELGIDVKVVPIKERGECQIE